MFLLFSSKATLKKQMSVRLSVCQPRLGGHVIFSAPNWDIAPIYFVQILLINVHLFCKYFVRLSVGNATKGFATNASFHPCSTTKTRGFVLWYYLHNQVAAPINIKICREGNNKWYYLSKNHKTAEWMGVFPCFFSRLPLDLPPPLFLIIINKTGDVS